MDTSCSQEIQAKPVHRQKKPERLGFSRWKLYEVYKFPVINYSVLLRSIIFCCKLMLYTLTCMFTHWGQLALWMVGSILTRMTQNRVGSFWAISPPLLCEDSTHVSTEPSITSHHTGQCTLWEESTLCLHNTPSQGSLSAKRPWSQPQSPGKT